MASWKDTAALADRIAERRERNRTIGEIIELIEEQHGLSKNVEPTVAVAEPRYVAPQHNIEPER